jgi:hypothetical protein
MMSHMTFSAPMGFLEAAGDVDGIIAGIKRDLRYFAVVQFLRETPFEDTKSEI